MMKFKKLKRNVWFWSLLAVIFAAVGIYLGVVLNAPVRISGGKLHYPAAQLQLDVPLYQRWELSENNLTDPSGYIAVWKQNSEQGDRGLIYLNVVQSTPNNQLTLEILRDNSLRKLALMGYAPMARNETLKTYYLVRGDDEVTGFYFQQLANGYLLSSYVSGRKNRFEVYRNDWQAMLQSIK